MPITRNLFVVAAFVAALFAAPANVPLASGSTDSTLRDAAISGGGALSVHVRRPVGSSRAQIRLHSPNVRK